MSNVIVCRNCGAENYKAKRVCRECFFSLREADGSETERNEAIFERRTAGATFREIAEEFGISRARAHQIYHRQRMMRCR